MPSPSRRLARLDMELAGLGDEAMMLDELDGLVAGLLVCPELIMPSAWLPAVWGSDSGEGPAFDSGGHLNRVFGLVLEHYNAVATALTRDPDRYAPLFATDPVNDEIHWEPWIEGFDKAITLRPSAFKQILDSDSEAAHALADLMTLADVARGDPRFSEDDLETLIAGAPDEIGAWVAALHKWSRAHGPTGEVPPFAKPGAKVGRNDPSPCGSGKKYKKCCGMN